MSKRRKKRPLRPLTEQQKKAAALIFAGHKMGETAAMIGVHRCTLWRWWQRRDFRREYERIRNRNAIAIRREVKKALSQTPQHKQELAARRKLKRLEKKLQAAGEQGDMIAYRKIEKEYDRCYNLAYFHGLSPIQLYKSLQLISTTKKRRKTKRYIVEILD